MEVNRIQSTNNTPNFTRNIKINPAKTTAKIGTSFPNNSSKLIDKSEHNIVYRLFARLYRNLIDKIDYIRE